MNHFFVRSGAVQKFLLYVYECEDFMAGEDEK